MPLAKCVDQTRRLTKRTLQLVFAETNLSQHVITDVVLVVSGKNLCFWSCF